MTSPVQDDVEEQMRQRRLREEARREKQRQGSSAENKMDVDNENMESAKEDSRIFELKNSICERKQRMDRFEAQIKQLQEEYNSEMEKSKKEEEELKQLQAEDKPNDVSMSESRQNDNSGNSTDSQNRQITNDEELARYLAAQFEREEQEQDAYLNERTIIEPRTISHYRIGFGNQGPGPTAISTSNSNPGDGTGEISFQFSSSTLPGEDRSVSSFHQTGFPSSALESFFGNDAMLTSGDPFQSSRGGFLFPFSMSPRDDPLSSMRILPRMGFPGRMFGGALMDENMDYETLMRLFPPAPTGAQATDIEQLPVDTFKAKSASESKEEEKKNSEKKEDEFHRCCICLESFKNGDEIRRLPCLHIFHTAEIDEWLIRNHLCPICRTPIEQNEPQQRP